MLYVPGCLQEGGPTNLLELKTALSKESVNLSLRTSDQLAETMSRQTDAVVKPHGGSA